MYNIPLLPNRFKKAGFIVTAIGLIAWIVAAMNGYQAAFLNVRVLSLFNATNDPNAGFAAIIQNNVLDELIGLTLIGGTILIGFSKEKQEHEFTMLLRSSALLWAMLIFNLTVFFGMAFLYELAFLKLMMYNLFTAMFVYIIRFHYLLYKTAKDIKYGK